MATSGKSPWNVLNHAQDHKAQMERHPLAVDVKPTSEREISPETSNSCGEEHLGHRKFPIFPHHMQDENKIENSNCPERRPLYSEKEPVFFHEYNFQVPALSKNGQSLIDTLRQNLRENLQDEKINELIRGASFGVLALCVILLGFFGYIEGFLHSPTL
ncbi:hypothetical protein PGT21_024377 [Puccinia graminis f. sp. tritici]|uniref:Uncharacterized protein n=1 Tax=Puccinia graminis f. sp. tritici TaxID=56615 RepID=A0A5B0PYL5_PUCGR|nr:hypothetical protein PGT21_024377 [Puccinia graminis f. sp. tritici]KAA1121000.1 hypothetical protein PGTUg99_025488 [Puccinia graminis f. sp. tritici]